MGPSPHDQRDMPPATSPPNRPHRSVEVTEQDWGSDYIADLIRAYGFEYVFYNPGSSFRAIQESIVNYNDNVPEIIEVPHEAIAIAMAQGYGKATGRPAVCLTHDLVGTLHGSMMLYTAFWDEAPLLVLSGTGPLERSKRRPHAEWVHTAQSQGQVVREFTKWDDQPHTIDDIEESFIRAIRFATGSPQGPTFISVDVGIQEDRLESPIPMPNFDAYPGPSKLGPAEDDIEKAAARLVDADFPVVIVDYVGRSRAAVGALVTLAETLGAPVFNAHYKPGSRLDPHRFNFPNTHPLDLSGTDAYRNADVVLLLDVFDPDLLLTDFDGTERAGTDAMAGPYDLIDIGVRELKSASMLPHTFELKEMAVSITADTEIAIPQLTNAIADRLAADTTTATRIDERAERIATLHAERHRDWDNRVKAAWDETPISLPRLACEVRDVVGDDPFVITKGMLRGWVYRTWDLDAFDQYTGSYSGGGGVGYGIGAAMGGALAYAETDRTAINFQPDGDLMYYLGALWTMGHYDIPVFTVVHNNGAYYNSTNHRRTVAAFRGRDTSLDRAQVGTGLGDPTPDYATIADGLGVAGYGPVTDPDDLESVLTAAWETVRQGKPALVDVVCAPR